MWQLPDAGRPERVDTAEHLARERLAPQPDWIIDLPRMYKTDAARQWIAELARTGGYQLYGSDGESNLLVRPGVAAPLPAGSAPAHPIPEPRDRDTDL